MYKDLKCRKCRKSIFDKDQLNNLLLNAHNLPLSAKPDICDTVNEELKIFLKEENIPGWIKPFLEAGEWSKGRINCQYCDSKIGGFDFISGSKCSCYNNVLPSVYIIKSKVDVMKPD